MDGENNEGARDRQREGYRQFVDIGRGAATMDGNGVRPSIYVSRSALPMPAKATLALVFLILVLLPGCAFRFDGWGYQEEEPYREDRLAEGISRRLADERTDLISDLAYDLEVALSSGASFRGRCRLDFVLAETVDDLVLDFRGKEVRSIEVNGVAVSARRELNHLVLPGGELVAGRNAIVVDYVGGIAASGEGIIRVEDKDDGSVYLYTLNVPADGHALLPCFDQPDLKAQLQADGDGAGRSGG